MAQQEVRPELAGGGRALWRRQQLEPCRVRGMPVGEGSLGGAEESAPGEISEGSSPMRGAGAHGRSGEGRLNNKNRGLNKERECTKGNGIRLPSFCTPCGVGLEQDTGNVRIFSICKYRNAAAEGVSTHTP